MSSTPYLWIAVLPEIGNAVELPSEVARHVGGVLRMREGELLRLFDGTGNALECRIETARRERVTVCGVSPWTGAQELPVPVRVSQALPKQSAKLESVLQHGTELGCTHFTVFASHRSIATWEPMKRGDRLERCRRIVTGAAEQSHRSRLPSVEWSDRGPFIGAGRPIVLHESAAAPLESVLSDPTPEGYTVAVGPEGGFTDEEVRVWTERGARAVHVGTRVLRTETAALAALARIGAFLDRK